MSRVIQPLLYILTGGVLAYYGYRAIKDAWDNPPEEEARKLVIAYDDDGNPIYDEDCDIDRTLDLWKEQSRLFKSA